MEVTNNLATWFLVFLFYAFIGWFYEGALELTTKHKAVNRGFLIGPICPIYGVGALILTFVLRGIDNIFIIFFAAMILCGILEYTTSYIMEKLFRVRWWDYSHEKFNLYGRICLKALLCFGIMSVIILKVVNPLIFGIIESTPTFLKSLLAISLFIIFLVDIALSLWIIMKYRVTVGTVNLDATDEITARVREVLASKGKLNRRLAKAFPTMKVDRIKATQAHIKTEAKVQVKAVKSAAKVKAKTIKAQTKNRVEAKVVKTEAKARAKVIKTEAKAKVKAVSKRRVNK